MELAFKSASASFIDRIIGLWTGSPFAHVELVFSEESERAILSLIAQNNWKIVGSPSASSKLCFSAEAVDGGTRFKWIDIENYDLWTPVPLPSSVRDRDVEAATLAGVFDGLKYDYMAILGFVFPFGEHRSPDRICSEVCAEILIDLHLPIKRTVWRISPGSLFDSVISLDA